MAIQDSFSVGRAIDSQSYAYKCWYNYHYGNNTMGIQSKDMAEITQTWKGEINNWQATALDDENSYEIEDDDFYRAEKNGKDLGKEKTGYDGKQGGQKTRAVGTALSSLGGAAASVVATTLGKKVGIGATTALTGKAAGAAVGKTAGAAIKEAGKKATEEATKQGLEKASVEAAKQTAEKTAEEGVKHTAKAAKVSAIVSAGIAIATASTYFIKKPNKEEKKACDELQNEMVNADNALMAAQDDISTMGEEINELSDEAQVINEETNEEIEDKKSEYDMYRASYDELMEKVEAGETLTEDEKALLKELAPLMEELGVGIQEGQEEATELTAELYDTMGEYQEGYDNAASTVGEVQGLTDYAESFDSGTKTMCYVEAGAQTLNAASGAAAGAKLLAGGPWFWALGGAAIAAGASSTVAAGQQFKWAGEVGTEIDMRKNTQDFTATTNEVYDESIEGYEGNLGIVEDLELEVPEDLEDVDAVVEEINAGTEEALGKPEKSDDKKKPKGTEQPTAETKPEPTQTGTDKKPKKKPEKI